VLAERRGKDWRTWKLFEKGRSFGHASVDGRLPNNKFIPFRLAEEKRGARLSRLHANTYGSGELQLFA
jgi:hypothetical protein